MKFYKVSDAIQAILDDDWLTPKVVYSDSTAVYIEAPWEAPYNWTIHQFICAYRKTLDLPNYVFFQIPDSFDTYEAVAWHALNMWMRDPSYAHFRQLEQKLEAIL